MICLNSKTHQCGMMGWLEWKRSVSDLCNTAAKNCDYAKRIHPRNPYLTVDAIIEMDGDKIVLIERKNKPFGFALPGGFVDYGESLEDAVCREVKEEVSMEFTIYDQFKAYSDPKRDPRQHVVSVVFVGTGIGEPVAADDAKENSAIVISPADALEKPLAFDHWSIIYDYMDWNENIRLRL